MSSNLTASAIFETKSLAYSGDFLFQLQKPPALSQETRDEPVKQDEFCQSALGVVQCFCYRDQHFNKAFANV